MECCHSLPMGALSQCAHTQTTTELLPQGSTHPTTPLSARPIPQRSLPRHAGGIQAGPIGFYMAAKSERLPIWAESSFLHRNWSVSYRVPHHTIRNRRKQRLSNQGLEVMMYEIDKEKKRASEDDYLYKRNLANLSRAPAVAEATFPLAPRGRGVV